MRSGRKLLVLPSVALSFFVLLACEGTTEVDEGAAKAAEDWAWLEQTKAEVDGKRSELAELKARISGESTGEEGAGGEGVGEEGAGGEGAGEEGAGGEGAGGEGAAEPPSPEELAAQADALQDEVYALADEFGARLAQFLNDQAISVGSERTEIQQQAFRMKSDEDIELAREYIEKGGEYQRGIDIYTQALTFDPDNEKLAAAKAEAEELRYMTEERLAEVKKNMTEGEVRNLLGTPKSQNVREFDGGVIGWFYPKEEPNTAAAVFYREKKGVLKVYKTDFEAVKSATAES